MNNNGKQNFASFSPEQCKPTTGNIDDHRKVDCRDSPSDDQDNPMYIYPTIVRQLKFNNGKCTNAFEIIANVNTLKMAYESIKSNPGNMTEGVDRETLDGIDENWFKETSKKLFLEEFRPKPARRVYIPKPNGKKRPLGISSPRDKIVQQAVKLVLDCVYESDFLDTSHGFRPKRGTHTALKAIRS